MDEFGRAFTLALHLIAQADPELVGIVGLSLRVSLGAAAIAFALGAPLGALLAIARFRGHTGLLIVLNALLGLPPVVVGLVVYLLVSRSGPLGSLGLLFTPGAMLLAQSLLALPIIAALVHLTSEGLWAECGDALRVDGVTHARAVMVLLAMGRAALLTALLAAFGRAIAEVGTIIMVDGNIRGYTRTMTTAIALRTSRGDPCPRARPWPHPARPDPARRRARLRARSRRHTSPFKGVYEANASAYLSKLDALDAERSAASWPGYPPSDGA